MVYIVNQNEQGLFYFTTDKPNRILATCRAFQFLVSKSIRIGGVIIDNILNVEK